MCCRHSLFSREYGKYFFTRKYPSFITPSVPFAERQIIEMKFSIIVPIYNVEKYIDKCVNSLLDQTYKNIEIILVDDGSPDGCPEKCDKYALQDNRVITIHKTNGGLSDARNAGLRIAKGDYIIFVDSDDYVELDTCEKLVPFTERMPQIIVADAIVEGGSQCLTHIRTDEMMNGEQYLLEAYRVKKAPMAAWLNIYNRKYLLENDLWFKKGILHEDEQFTPRAFLKAEKVVVSNQLFYHYIIRENSITTKKDKRKNADDLYSTCCELEQIYKQINNQELKKYLLNSLADKYLSLFQSGELYRYGSDYIHKNLIVRNAKMKRTKIKSALYFISPKLYFIVNQISKRGKE